MWEIEIDFIMPFNRAYVNQFCEIVYKKKDEWYIEWQRVTTNDNNDNQWQRVVQRVTTSGTTSESEWQWMKSSHNEWPRVTTNDNEWYNEWQRVAQQMKASESKWEWF